MPFGLIGGVVSGLMGMHGAKKQREHDAWVAEQNFALQQENLQWQREAQQTTWNREDNAVQRRVADLQAAGLSPVLAAGSAAQTHTPISTQAPQRERVDQQRMAMADMFLNLTRQSAEIARTKAETARIRKQTEMIDPLYQLDLQKVGFEMQRVANDTERVRQASKQLGINERSLQNDIQRVAHDFQRVQLQARQVLNEEARTVIQQNAQESLKLLHDAQIGRISEQNLVSELQRKGMDIDQATQVVRYQQLIYDYALSVEYGTKTNDPLSNLYGFSARLGDMLGGSPRSSHSHSVALQQAQSLVDRLFR